MAVLFLPILAGMWMKVLYPWTFDEPARGTAGESELPFKMRYLTQQYFTDSRQ